MVKIAKSRKRNRLETEANNNLAGLRDSAADCSCDSHNIRPSQKRARKPFSGKVFAVSTLFSVNMNKSSDESESQERETDDRNNYKGLVSLCESGGAKAVSQVHKNVFCVVATINAIQGETQRVRKAWKKGIPVVRVDWVRNCLRAQSLLPFGDYLVSIPSTTANKNMTSNSVQEGKVLERTKHGATRLDDSSMKERTLDLGCCCVCHETGLTDCEWCLDCTSTKHVTATSTTGTKRETE